MAMWAIVPPWILKSDLTRIQQLVWGILGAAGDENKKAYTTTKELAASMGTSVTYVSKALREMQERGYLASGKDEKGKYYLVITPLQEQTPVVVPAKPKKKATKKKKTAREKFPKKVTDIYDLWVAERAAAKTLGNAPPFTEKLGKYIYARYNDGFSQGDLENAVRGCFQSDFHVTNGHIGLDLICRNSDKVNQFIKRYNDNKGAISATERYQTWK